MTLSTQTRQTHNPIDTSDTTATPSTTSEAPANRVHRGVDTRIQAAIIGVVLAAVSIGVWQLAVTAGWLSDLAPTPARTFSRGVEILSDPFYRDGPGSVGIFWHVPKARNHWFFHRYRCSHSPGVCAGPQHCPALGSGPIDAGAAACVATGVVATGPGAAE